MAYPIPPPEKMDMDGDLRENWSLFKLSWTNYADATRIDTKPAKVQVGTFLSIVGKECLKIIKNLPMTEEERVDINSTIKKLSDYFEPKLNTTYERYVFNSCDQEIGERFDAYLNKLRKLIKTCRYSTLEDELLRDRIVMGTNNKEIRTRLLSEPDLTLDRTIDICRSTEQRDRQVDVIGSRKTTETVHYTQKAEKRKLRREHIKDCKFCGLSHDKGKCQAYGLTCAICLKRNHVARMCQSQAHPPRSNKLPAHAKVRYVNDEPASSDESIYALDPLSDRKHYYANIHVSPLGGQKALTLKFQIDTGASCSTLALVEYKRLTTAPLQPSHIKLKLYDNSILQPLGAVTLWCEANNIKKKVHFQVVDNNSPSLLSGWASSALQLIAFNVECIRHLDEVKSLTKEGVLDNCKDVFSGLGRLPGECKIQIEKNIKPVQNNPRRVPLPLKMELKQKLEELVEQGVIAWVTEPTPWISNIVVIRKPHKLRICIDPYHLNKAIQRNHYPTPTVEEIATKMSKARLFSVIDTKDGFLQVALDESSSYLTTRWTPFGRIRWLRMPLGISSAPEKGQRRLDHCFEGLDNTKVIADDTIIYGSGENDAEADKSHDTAFRALIERCREKGLKRNPKKLNFKQTSVSYMGHIFSAQGLAADPEKVKAVSQMQYPTDVQGVQRVLGVANYLAKFTPKLSTVCEPLRRLLDKDSVFDWLPPHETAFSRMKELITQAPVLQYYDVNKEVSLECDSLEVGLGAVIKQGGHPIVYASRALCKTERNYVQIEKEDLVIGQPIRVKCHPQNPNSDWTPGIVTSKAAPRSYMVQVDGQQYRRNRIHLRQQATFPDRAPTEPLNIRPRQLDTLPDQTPADPQYTPIQTCTSQTHEIQTCRSSRPVQVPARLKDHDLSKGRCTKQKLRRKGKKGKKKKRKKHIGTLL